MRGIFVFIGALGAISFLAFGATRIVAYVEFGIECGDYIVQAASSPNPAIAADKISAALAYADAHGMTSDNTGIIFSYPTYDVGFWHQRLVDSRMILNQLQPNDSPLETSNTMIRVHETLVHGGKEGETEEAPDGISVFPHNVAFAVWGWTSSFAILLGFGLAILL